jgi:hypothetical protein
VRQPKSAYVERVRADSRQAQNKIAQQFTQRPVHPSEDPTLRAWGQYLFPVNRDHDSDLGDQYGIFGTTAGLQVLAGHSPGEYRNVLAAACQVLPPVKHQDATSGGPEGEAVRSESVPGNELWHEPTGPEAVHARFVDKGDLKVVYKLCALLDAVVVLSRDEQLRKSIPCGQDLVLGALLGLRVSSAGWPDHVGLAREYHEPNVHATAVALLSIGRGALTDESIAHCSEALQWLAGSQLHNQSVATLSMIVLAIEGLRRRSENDAFLKTHVSQLLARCQDALRSWTTTTAPVEVRRSLEGTEYRLPPEGSNTPEEAHFEFLMYLPHCLVALACLASPRLLRSGRSRRFAVGVVDVVAQEAKQHGYFVAAGRSLVSAVEHLWLYRLLTAFVSTSPVQPNWRAVLADWLARRRWSRVNAVIAVVLFIGLGVSVAVTHGPTRAILEPIWAAVLAVTAGVGVGIVSRNT